MARDFSTADKLRDELEEMGVQVSDEQHHELDADDDVDDKFDLSTLMSTPSPTSASRRCPCPGE